MNAQLSAFQRHTGSQRNTQVWQDRISALDFALQPIVSIHTGQALGYECLLRDMPLAGLERPADFFDAAHAEQMLSVVEHALREKALRKFATIPHHAATRLFLNVDGRYFETAHPPDDPTPGLLKKLNLPAATLCLEISERHPLLNRREVQAMLAAMRKADIRIALDDFGTGFSGLQALYIAQHSCPKQVTGMAQLMG